MTITVRLDPETERSLDSACAKAGITRSGFIRDRLREALAEYQVTPNAYELGKHLPHLSAAEKPGLHQRHPRLNRRRVAAVARLAGRMVEIIVPPSSCPEAPMSSSSSSPELDQARDHLRKAAQLLGDRLIGAGTAHHLRQAARSALLAGVAAIDQAEARYAAPATDVKPY